MTAEGLRTAVGVGISCRLGNYAGQAMDARTRQWVAVPAVLEGALVSQATTASGCYVRWNGHEFYVPEWAIIERGAK